MNDTENRKHETMKIRYTHAHGTSATGLPKGDPLTRYAAEAYGFTLNTDTRRNR